MAVKKKRTFEESISRLEEIVSLLGQGEAPLDQALALFEEGAKLTKECTAQLDKAEQKVKLLTMQEEESDEL